MFGLTVHIITFNDTDVLINIQNSGKECTIYKCSVLRNQSWLRENQLATNGCLNSDEYTLRDRVTTKVSCKQVGQQIRICFDQGQDKLKHGSIVSGFYAISENSMTLFCLSVCDVACTISKKMSFIDKGDIYKYR